MPVLALAFVGALVALSPTSAATVRARVPALLYASARVRDYELNLTAVGTRGRGLLDKLRETRTVVMAAPANRCWPHGSSTIVSDAGGRIFDFPAGKTGKILKRGLARTYGCLYSRGHPYPLDDPDARSHGRTQIACLGKRCAAIDGPYAAYGVEGAFPSCYGAPGCPTPLTKVSIMDLRIGHIVSTALDSHNLLLSVAVSRVPVAAWTIESSISGSLGYAVQALNRHGLHQIAESPGVDPDFVRVVGHTVYWCDDGQLRSNTLPYG